MTRPDYKTAGLLLVLSLGCVAVAIVWEQRLPRLIALSAAAAFFGVSVAYVFSWPGLLGKKRSGHLVPSSYFLFWPYHLFSYLSLLIFRLTGESAPFNEIEPGLYLGSRLLSRDERAMAALKIASVLDLTAEFPEVPFLRKLPAYLCIPLLDRTAPSQAQLKTGIAFIRERLPQGPVYVHCALGHGRSATVVLAYLVSSGKFANVETAIQHVRRKRPNVDLHACQRQALDQYIL